MSGPTKCEMLLLGCDPDRCLFLQVDRSRNAVNEADQRQSKDGEQDRC